MKSRCEQRYAMACSAIAANSQCLRSVKKNVCKASMNIGAELPPMPDRCATYFSKGFGTPVEIIISAKY